MKKKLLLGFAIAMATNGMYAQTTEQQAAAAAKDLTTAKKDLKDGWNKGGTFNLSLTTAGRNDYWVKGGEEQTVAIRGIVDYNFDRKKGKTNWLNNFRGRYGVQKATSTGKNFLKNDDYLNFNSIYGKQFSKNWSYAGYFGLESQFEDAFLTPGYIKAGPGFLYKPNAHFSALMSPAMANVTTKLKKSLKNVDAFGVDAGKTARFGIGAFIQANANYDLAKGINYRSVTAIYSDYLDDPQNVVLDMNNLFTFTVNKYIGATLTLNARYNDREVNRTQLQYALGVGFNYKL
jgi:Protein of unknown function (DUF3078)